MGCQLGLQSCRSLLVGIGAIGRGDGAASLPISAWRASRSGRCWSRSTGRSAKGLSVAYLGVRKDLTGKRYGQLVVTGLAGKRGRRFYWDCKCDCGNVIAARSDGLACGDYVSCGCAKGWLHGGTGSPEHKAWSRMLDRCYCPTNKAFKHYGARGIDVCAAWRASFAAFLSDVGSRPSPQHSLDRRNNNRGYYPDNVRWATKATQGRNRRTTKLSAAAAAEIRSLKGRATQKQLAEKFHVHPSMISRVQSGKCWSTCP